MDEFSLGPVFLIPLDVHGQQVSLDFLLGRRDAVRWAKTKNCKSFCKSALNAEDNLGKLQLVKRITDKVCTITPSLYVLSLFSEYYLLYGRKIR